MRIALTAVSLLSLVSFATPGQADPYRWCAVYGVDKPICYFKTLESCRKATPVDGGCVPNLAYSNDDSRFDGRRNRALRY